nr:uncharacterized MFS-type transporter C18.02-like [Quercus suber]
MVSQGVAKLLNTLQIRADPSYRPAGLSWRSNTYFILATIAIGLFSDLFLYGLVVPILPFMLRERVGVPHDQVQSHVSGLLAAYAAATVVSAPLAGILADRLKSRQAPFLAGLLALLGGTAMLFTGNTVPLLVLARIFQGVSAAFVWTVGLALCLETVGPENLGKTIGAISSIISTGSLAAPLVGGVLYDKAGYAGVFGIAFAVLAVDFIMRLLVIEKKVAEQYEEFPVPTTENMSGGNDGAVDEEAEPTNESNEESPLLQNKKEREDDANFKLSEDQPRIFRAIPILPCLANPRLLTAFLVAFVQATLLGSFDATIPTVAESFYHFSSLESGLLFLPLGIFDLILGPLFGYFVDRFGTKPVAVLSYAYLVPVLALFRIPHAVPIGSDPKTQVIIYGALLALSGIGLAGIGAPSIVESGLIVQRYHKANKEHFGKVGPYAQLYGLNSMVFSLGLAVGPEIAGNLKDTIGYGNMNAVLAGLCGATAILCFLFIGRPVWTFRTKK